MSRVPFEELPGHSRVWVFGSNRPLDVAESRALLAEVDRYLDQWKAHGVPLRCARDWREQRFLAIGVDPTTEQASGCSIDGLYRSLRQLEQTLGTVLLAGGRVFYRAPSGEPRSAGRQDVAALAARGELTPATQVFDTSVTDAEGYRQRFERPGAETWVASLLPKAQASQSSSRSATNASSARKG